MERAFNLQSDVLGQTPLTSSLTCSRHPWARWGCCLQPVLLREALGEAFGAFNISGKCGYRMARRCSHHLTQSDARSQRTCSTQSAPVTQFFMHTESRGTKLSKHLKTLSWLTVNALGFCGSHVANGQEQLS